VDISDAGLTRASVFVLIFLFLSFSTCHSTQENDLWLLLSTYEDIGITVKDLAFFLATHGFDAEPKESYVVVKFAGGKEAYL
jgi:hypothetical protein